ncbi:hypothetical protein PR048_028358 [Dryococelus australis]|uniref:DUF4817 domain-containing protein n=1 Tax=Dryococelus australis TaxID=614101 RepID=A0ABQ9GJ33_9NEOP|nr:hypothetical protein PR048_028358 [Dryococelus australis]
MNATTPCKRIHPPGTTNLKQGDQEYLNRPIHRRQSEEVNYVDVYGNSLEKSALSEEDEEEGVANEILPFSSSNEVPKSSESRAEEIQAQAFHKPPFISIPKSEQVDLQLVYGEARSNVRAVVRIYQERFPHRRVLHRNTFTAVAQRLCDMVGLKVNNPDVCARRSVRTPQFEDDVLNQVADQPSTSTYDIVCNMP